MNKRNLKKKLKIGVLFFVAVVMLFRFSDLSMLVTMITAVYVILDYKLEKIYEKFMERR